MTTMNRRELLQRVAYLMGGAVSTPAVLGLMQGCVLQPGNAWQPQFLSANQVDTVTEIADIMIPRTDTPGAIDIGIPAFIDSMLKTTYAQTDQERYVTGLEAFEVRAQQEYKQPFKQLDHKQRVALVQRVHDEALAVQGTGFTMTPSPRPFVLMTKELVLLGYFISEVGATKVLQYDPVPGAYHGCVPLSQAGNGKTWAMEPPTWL